MSALPPLEELKELPPPHEILELPSGGLITFGVEGFEIGSMVIHPRYRGAPPEKKIHVLRVYVPKKYKSYFPYYWDITAKTLIAQLLPFLKRPDYKDYEFTIIKHGVPPKARFELRVRKIA